MKRRILSFCLALAMVATLFVIPINAAGSADVFTYDFEEEDARNYVEGQVFDVAAVGEAKKAPTLSGNKSEYAISGSFDNLSGGADLPVYMSVKDGYLYFAFESATQQRMQYDLGVAKNHKSDTAISRARFVWNVDNSFTNQTPLLRVDGSATEITGLTTLNSANALVDKNYSNGLQEVKIDLEYLYRFFAGTGRGQGTYQSPCVSIVLYSLTSSTWYGINVSSSLKIDSECPVNIAHLPYTVIIPRESFELINDKKDEVGPFGYDQRNAVEGQLYHLPNYAEKAPTLDGTVDFENGEYSLHRVINGTDTYYSVKDGYIYVALKYADTASHTEKRTYFYYGLAGHSEASPYCIFNTVLNPATGAVTNQSINMRNPVATGSSIPTANAFSGLGTSRGEALTDWSASTVNDVTVIETKISIAVMASVLEDAGWESETANVFQMWLGPHLSLFTYSLPSATILQVRGYTGISISSAMAVPTLLLPDGCVEKYSAQGVDKLEGYGQKHTYAAPSAVKLDGVIGGSEYTGSYSYTKDDLRTADSAETPNFTDDIGGINYFAYDKDNLYVGAKVFDKNYVSGKSTYQLNIGVLKDDGIVDLGEGVTRMSIYGRVIDGNSAVFAGGSKPSGTLRHQNYTSAEETAWIASMPSYADGGYEIAGSYDETTGTITYEFKIPMSVLESVFGVDKVEKLSILNYIIYIPEGSTSSASAWQLFKLIDEDKGALKAIQNYTLSDNNISSFGYRNNFFGNIVELKELSTKDAASVRLATASTSGLRFKTTYSDDYLAKMQALADARGEELEIGTVIAPVDYVKEVSKFTMESLEKLNVATPYVNVKATVNAPFQKSNGTTTYAGSLVNIGNNNLAREFAAIGYVKIGELVYYSESYTVRTISDIAKTALADVKDTANSEYKYPTAGGKYSCYNETYQNMLASFVTDTKPAVLKVADYKHVVIIGADGAGTFDTDTPNIVRIFANGGVSKNVITANPTISAQAWASLLHGVTPDRHQVTNYSAAIQSYSNRSLYPSIFDVINGIDSDSDIGSIVRWAPINTGIVENSVGTTKINSTTDANVTVDVCDYVRNEAPKFLFVQYNQADGMGETYGFTSTEYYDAIKWVDGEVGKIYAAYEESGLLEDTLFIVTADHGGLGKRHGGLSDVEKTIMVAAAGSTVQKGTDLMKDMEIRDLAAVALYALGYKCPETWSARVPSGFFKGVVGGDRPVFEDVYSSRYHVSVATPKKGEAGYIDNYMSDNVTLINHLTFDETVADECGGTTTQHGTIPYVDGYHGKGADLSYGYVSVDDFACETESFTIAFWYNTNGLAQDPAFISNKNWNSGKNKGFVISLALDSDGSPVAWINVADGTNRFDKKIAMPSDYMSGWVHVIVTFDRVNNQIRFCYDFDTNKITTVSLSDSLKTSSFAGYSDVINIGQDGTGNYAAKVLASIDDYMLFSGAFDKAEIANLAAYYGK